MLLTLTEPRARLSPSPLRFDHGPRYLWLSAGWLSALRRIYVARALVRSGVKVKLSTPHGTLLFPTPVGKSYTCDNEQVVTMFSQVNATVWELCVEFEFCELNNDNNISSGCVCVCEQDANDKSGHLAKLYLRDLRMQAFMYKAASTWGPSFQCSATGKLGENGGN